MDQSPASIRRPASLERAFSQFILDPIFKIFAAVMKFKKDENSNWLSCAQSLEIKLTGEEKDLAWKAVC